MDMGSSDPDDIAAAFGFAFGLVIAGFLFLFPVGRPAIIGATFDIEPGMGKGPREAARSSRRFCSRMPGMA